MKRALLLIIFLLVSFAGELLAQQWVQTNGPTDDNLTSISFNSRKDLFVLSNWQTGILIRSTDNGASWKRISPPGATIRNITIMPNNDIYINYFDSSGIYLSRSTDNGVAWTQLRQGEFDNLMTTADGKFYATALAQDQDSGSTPYYLLWSLSTTDTWDSVKIRIPDLGTINHEIYDIAIDSNGIFILNTRDGIFTSSDKGKSWSQRLTTAFTQIVCGSGGNIFLVSYDFGPLFQSTNDGLSWKELSVSPLRLCRTRTGRLLSVGFPFQYSDDNGISWKEYGGEDQMNILATGDFFTPDAENGFFCLINDILYHAAKPGVDPWTVYSVPLSSVYSEIVASDGSVIASTGSVFRSPDGGASWAPVQINPIRHYSSWFIVDSNKDVIESSDVLLLSSDNGTDWLTLSHLSAFNPGALLGGVVYPDGRILIASLFNGLFLSSDRGDIWQKRTIPAKYLTAVGLSNDGVLYAADSGLIYVSPDSGNTWVMHNTGLGVITGFAFDSYGDIFTTDSRDGISLSIDHARTWMKFTKGIPAEAVINTLLPTPSGIVFAGTSEGVYMTGPQFCSWTPYSAGLTSSDILSLAIDAHGRLYAGSAGCGVFKSTDTFNLALPVIGRIGADDVDFGTVAIGDTVCKPVVVRNIGLAPFTLAQPFTVVDPVPFSVDPQSAAQLPRLLQPKDSLVLDICFHPFQPGNYASEVDWTTDLSDSICTAVKPQSVLHGSAFLKNAVTAWLPEAGFSIRPDPSSGNSVTVSFSRMLLQAASLSLYDVVGREVWRHDISPGINEFDLPVQNLSEGTYYLLMASNGIVRSEKFIKTK